MLVCLSTEGVNGWCTRICLFQQVQTVGTAFLLASNVDQQLNNDNIKIVDFLVSSQRETSRDSALENAHLYFKNTCDLLRGQLFCSTKYPNIST